MPHSLFAAGKPSHRSSVFFILCFALLFLFPALGQAELLRLAVVGVSNATDEPEFGKLLIAQGIAHLVAQELYDTGRYVPVEDNAEISGRIQELLARSANAPDPAVEPVDRADLGCDAVATARIVSFDKSRFRGFAGPFSSGKVKVELTVEVSVREGEKPPVRGSGSGSGTTKARGVLFQIREDQVHFDQTSVGQATQEAVSQAVAGLMRQMEEGQ
ncbi:hypothetical protein [Trichloromonas sp.]|uniref:hypothetical protein n=1 Tax=Trichloromonas sp. TaxID=3069249 RepID=UPI002A443DFD|nr:hypothetical protein [Trichloromonas sp.]